MGPLLPCSLQTPLTFSSRSHSILSSKGSGPEPPTAPVLGVESGAVRRSLKDLQHLGVFRDYDQVIL